MNPTIINDNKRIGLIWAAIAVFAGIAILVHLMWPDIFNFWGSVGLFLVGSGIASLIIDKVMEKPGFPVMPVVVIGIGAILVIINVVSKPSGSLAVMLGAIALIIIGIAAGISIIRRKN